MPTLAELQANNTPLPGTNAGAAVVAALLNPNTKGQLANYAAGVRTRSLLEGARRARDKNIGFSDITPEALIQAGADPRTALITSAMLHAGVNPNSYANAELGYQKHAGIDEAMRLAQGGAGNIPAMDRVIAAFMGKPLEATRNEEGTLIQPYAAPSQQGDLITTDVGQSQIGRNNAEASAASARAALTNKKADSMPGGTKPTLPHMQALTYALGGSIDPHTGMVVIPPGKMNSFLLWQSQMAKVDPKYNNGDYALMHYPEALAHPAPTTGGQDGTGAAGSVQPRTNGKYGPGKYLGDSPYPEGFKVTDGKGNQYVIKDGKPQPITGK